MTSRKSIIAAFFAALAALAVLPVHAETDQVFDMLDGRGSAGLGLLVRVSTSPYGGVGQTEDLIPLYLYEGEHAYLHSYRAGLRYGTREQGQFEVFLAHHFEGFPYDRKPKILEGMDRRNPGVDAGIGYRLSGSWGNASTELRRDVTGESDGVEMRFAYGYNWRSGRWLLHPYASMSVRDSKLNNYYYGVLDQEATATRPAYIPGSGFNFETGFYARYDVTERWRLLAGFGAEHLSSQIRDSPIVDTSWQVSGYMGAAYEFTDSPSPWTDRTPIIIKAFYGDATDCTLNAIIRLTCTSLSTEGDTRIIGLHVGKPFMENVMGWPLDFIGYVGAVYHDERNMASDSWQIDTYMKAFWRGFPWSKYVRTRLGFGLGLSYATRVPYVEARDQANRGRDTSKLLNYLDPSVDINVGDILRKKSLKETWFGLAVSHRSGVFGSAELLGNTNGGSNYIYTYIETKL